MQLNIRRTMTTIASASLVVGTLVVGAPAFATTTPTCTSVSTSQGPLTAALIDPATVPTTVDAAGCDIGIYYGPGTTGSVNGATVSGATDYGIFNDGGNNVAVTNSTISQIGNQPLNGDQSGIAVYFGNGGTGTINDNTINNYQKGGVVVDGAGTSATVDGNTVTGLGVFPLNAQNGIQFGFGATPISLQGNTVTGNIYTEGAANGYVATGILLYQANVSNLGPHVVSTIERDNAAYQNQANVTYVK